MGILDSVLRGGLEDYMISEGTGLQVPRSVRAVDSILMQPEKLYTHDDFEARQRRSNQQRAEFMDNSPAWTRSQGGVPEVAGVSPISLGEGQGRRLPSACWVPCPRLPDVKKDGSF